MIAQNQNRMLRSRRGFTLIELMIVIMIIGILSALVGVVMNGAINDAKQAKTEAQIARIDALIMEAWEEFEYRQVRFRYLDPTSTPDAPIALGAGVPPQYATKARLYALRALQRMEMPDRMTDLIDFWRVPDGGGGLVALDPNYNAGIEALSQTIFVSIDTDADGILDTEDQTTPAFQIEVPVPALLRRYRTQLLDAWGTDIAAAYNIEHQGAECLYMILGAIESERGTGLDFFSSDEIGDLDEDGLPEILDAWGNPIEFIRWPAGFRSPVQQVTMQDFAAAPLTNDDFDEDSFDFVESDPRKLGETDHGPVAFQPYRIQPLIFSAGEDGVYDIVRNIQYNYAPIPGGIQDTHYAYPWSVGGSLLNPPNDPYFYDAALGNAQMGSVFNGQPNLEDGDDSVGEYFDNITNQTDAPK